MTGGSSDLAWMWMSASVPLAPLVVAGCGGRERSRDASRAAPPTTTSHASPEAEGQDDAGERQSGERDDDQ
jgi:hypothetical protein